MGQMHSFHFRIYYYIIKKMACKVYLILHGKVENGKYSHSNKPNVVGKAQFSVSLGWIGICQYLLARTNVEKNFACTNQSKRVSILGNGSVSVLVMEFYLQKGTQSSVFSPSSHLCTKITGRESGEHLSLMIPACNNVKQKFYIFQNFFKS